MTTTTAANPALAAVAALIRRDSLRPEGSDRTLHAPCLLAQLAEAVSVGTESMGGRAVPGSRPPVAVDALDLWVEIVYNTHGWAVHLGIERRDATPEADTPHVGRLLRSVAATAESRGRAALAGRIEEKATRWCTQITAMLHGRVPQRPVRGASCPDCWAIWVNDEREDGTYRTPAIAIVAGDVPWLVCNACGWNGAAVDPTDVEVTAVVGGDREEDR